jgi:hypothetical protein
MSAGVVEQIFKEFKFRTLSNTSSKNQIYKSIVNTACRANIICSRFGTDKNVSDYLNEDMKEWLPRIEDLCANFLRKTTEKFEGVVFIEDDQICVDEGDY